jgi:hypothetical protein
MGFGRSDWCSYDLLYNRDRRSARATIDYWQDVSAVDTSNR